MVGTPYTSLPYLDFLSSSLMDTQTSSHPYHRTRFLEFIFGGHTTHTSLPYLDFLSSSLIGTQVSGHPYHKTKFLEFIFGGHTTH